MTRRRLVCLLLASLLLSGARGGVAAASVSGQHTLKPGAMIPADFFPDARGMFRKGKSLPLRHTIVFRRAAVTQETRSRLKCGSGYRMVSLATDETPLAFIVDRADRKYRGRLRTVRMTLYPAYPNRPGRGRIFGLCFKKR